MSSLGTPTGTGAPDGTSRAFPPGGPAAPDGPRPPFWRRRGFLVVGAVVLIVAVSVIVDLPQASTPASKRADARGIIREIAKDAAGCNAALGEAFTIYHQEMAGTLTAAHRSEAPGILADDANGCSFTSQSVYDLASLDLPQASIGKPLNHIAGRVFDWVDPDGLTAVDDIATLLDHPHDARATLDLRHQIDMLQADRAAAMADEQHLADQLHGTLPSLGLRAIRS